jgi:hypothetical protein
VGKPSRSDIEDALYSTDREVRHCGMGCRWETSRGGSPNIVSAVAAMSFCLALADQWLGGSHIRFWVAGVVVVGFDPAPGVHQLWREYDNLLPVT